MMDLGHPTERLALALALEDSRMRVRALRLELDGRHVLLSAAGRWMRVAFPAAASSDLRAALDICSVMR